MAQRMVREAVGVFKDARSLQGAVDDLLIAGFEVEYADTSEDLVLGGPRLRTFMFNGLAQTPIPIAGMQFYATLGGGLYRESISTEPDGNETSFGLASGIWTRDINKAHRTAHRLRAGTVWINCYSVFDAAMPFGGYKESGWGREMGHNALDNYLETKSVVTQLA